MLDALPYGYSELKFTPNHCTPYHIAYMNYIYILLALCTFIRIKVDVPRCMNVVVFIP
jgi:hypothetical protein